MTRRHLVPCTLLVVLASWTFLHATGDTGGGRTWKDTAEFSAVVTTGNSENSTVAASNKLVYARDSTELTVDASFLRSEATRFERTNDGGEPRADETEETTADAYGLGLIYRRKVRDGFLAYANTGWERKRIKGIQDRYRVGAGMGYRFLENERRKLLCEAGASWTEETRVDDSEVSFGDARAFLSFEQKITDSSALTTEMEILESLRDSEDLRLTSLTSVTASITERIALKVSYGIEYDRQPVEVTLAGDPAAVPAVPDALFEFESTDTTLSSSLVINF